ncbi:MAG: sensor domain-containing diguanylate cyclase [Wenzhouxiangellaceae bacterium]
METEAVSTTMLDRQLFLTIVVAGMWWAVYRPLLGQTHYRWWAWGWTVFLMFLIGVRISFTPALPSMFATFLHTPAGLLQVACFILGAEALRRGTDPPTRVYRFWLVTAALLGTLLGSLHYSIENETVGVITRTLVRSPPLALALAYCGLQLLRQHRGATTPGVWITAGGFFLYALNHFVYSTGAIYQAGILLFTHTGTAQLGEPLILSTSLNMADMLWQAAIGAGAILLLVHEKDQLYRASRKNERRFQALFERSVDGIVMADGSARIRDANPAAVSLLGFENPELEGRSLYDLIGDDNAATLPSPDEVEMRGGLTLETTCRTSSGETIPVELSLSAYTIGDQRHVQCIMRDISSRQVLMDQLTHRATHVPLTNLPNRLYFNDELKRMLAMMRRQEAHPAVLFLDLDDFKQVNDVYGHATGDALLLEVAGRLRRCVRGTELVGHLGGDEFVVLVPWCDAEPTLRVIGDRIAQALAEPYEAEGHTLHNHASIGGAIARPEDTNDTLLQRADRAMYQAKQNKDCGSRLCVLH